MTSAIGMACDEQNQRRQRRQARAGGEPALHPRPQPDLHARGHQRHPHQVGARPLPHARLLALQEDPALGRPDLPARHADPLRHRGLSREMRDEDGDRPAGQAAVRARHPGLRHRHELWRALLRGEDRARPRRHDGRLRHLLGRGRHDPRRAPLFDQSGSTSASSRATASTRIICGLPTPASSSSARAARSASAAI